MLLGEGGSPGGDPGSLARLPQPWKALPGGSSGLWRRSWRPGGHSAAAPLRPSARNSGPSPFGRQAPVPLLLGGGWANSRAATVASSFHRRTSSLGSCPPPFGSLVVPLELIISLDSPEKITPSENIYDPPPPPFHCRAGANNCRDAQLHAARVYYRSTKYACDTVLFCSI